MSTLRKTSRTSCLAAAVALTMFSCPGHALPAIGTVHTVTGTINYATCGVLDGQSTISKGRGGISFYPFGAFLLNIQVLSDNGVYQSYSITTNKYCPHFAFTPPVENFHTDFPQRARIEIQVRALKHPDLCQSNRIGGPLTSALLRQSPCGYGSGVKSIRVNGRKVY